MNGSPSSSWWSSWWSGYVPPRPTSLTQLTPRASAPVAKLLRSVTIRGVRYSVLRFSPSPRGPRFLLRDDHGRIFGVWPVSDDAFKAELLEPASSTPNPLEGVGLSETGDGLAVG